MLIDGPNPPTAILSSEEKIQQIVEAANYACADLASRYDWQALQREVVFTAFNAEIQGPISFFTEGFNRIIPFTFWNRTQTRQVSGPLSPQEWQEALSSGSQYPYSESFRLHNNDLLLHPIPILGEVYAFEYYSLLWNGTHDTFISDDDVPIYPEELVIRGAKWAYLEARGLDYEEAFRSYDMMAADVSASDQSSAIRSQSYAQRNIKDRNYGYNQTWGA